MSTPTWVKVQALPWLCFVTFHNILRFSESEFSHLWKEGEEQPTTGQGRLDLVILLAGSSTSCFKDYMYVIGLNTT